MKALDKTDTTGVFTTSWRGRHLILAEGIESPNVVRLQFENEDQSGWVNADTVEDDASTLDSNGGTVVHLSPDVRWRFQADTAGPVIRVSILDDKHAIPAQGLMHHGT